MYGGPIPRSGAEPALTYRGDMAGALPSRSSEAAQEIEFSLPFAGLWLARNSPTRRVRSHGSDLFGERYAIDFIGVDDHHRTAGIRDWRTFFATEPPERFFALGQPILAPGSGTIANCGNSGNSTQPHVHVQAMDSADLSVARGVPMVFRRFREWPSDAKHLQVRERGVPGEGAVVEPLPIPSAAPGP